MVQQRKTYSDEFKQEAIRLIIEEDLSAREVGARLDVHPTSVASWVRKYKQGGVDLTPGAAVIDKDAELRKLRKELEQIKTENDFLKKATAYFAQHQK